MASLIGACWSYATSLQHVFTELTATTFPSGFECLWHSPEDEWESEQRVAVDGATRGENLDSGACRDMDSYPVVEPCFDSLIGCGTSTAPPCRSSHQQEGLPHTESIAANLPMYSVQHCPKSCLRSGDRGVVRKVSFCHAVDFWFPCDSQLTGARPRSALSNRESAAPSSQEVEHNPEESAQELHSSPSPYNPCPGYRGSRPTRPGIFDADLLGSSRTISVELSSHPRHPLSKGGSCRTLAEVSFLDAPCVAGNVLEHDISSFMCFPFKGGSCRTLAECPRPAIQTSSEVLHPSATWPRRTKGSRKGGVAIVPDSAEDFHTTQAAALAAEPDTDTAAGDGSLVAVGATWDDNSACPYTSFDEIQGTRVLSGHVDWSRPQFLSDAIATSLLPGQPSPRIMLSELVGFPSPQIAISQDRGPDFWRAVVIEATTIEARSKL